MEVIHGKPTNPGCKAFVQPKLIPPIHGNKVAEPLVSQLYYLIVRYTSGFF